MERVTEIGNGRKAGWDAGGNVEICLDAKRILDHKGCTNLIGLVCGMLGDGLNNWLKESP